MREKGSSGSCTNMERNSRRARGALRPHSQTLAARHNSVLSYLEDAEALFRFRDLCCDCEERFSLFGDDD